ncbi:Translation initiation factor eIF-2B subunit epsilon [Batrachochytrium dendrobatidis]|nr:Translation initiation factor eIF-2B subunit epsilon [Batrachochytrium dendrobatidis]KAK5664642.1 Translation initiation factor eIF-2B subunit epsilon [Batrachochytrium dendrobatidis]
MTSSFLSSWLWLKPVQSIDGILTINRTTLYATITTIACLSTYNYRQTLFVFYRHILASWSTTRTTLAVVLASVVGPLVLLNLNDSLGIESWARCVVRYYRRKRRRLLQQQQLLLQQKQLVLHCNDPPIIRKDSSKPDSIPSALRCSFSSTGSQSASPVSPFESSLPLPMTRSQSLPHTSAPRILGISKTDSSSNIQTVSSHLPVEYPTNSSLYSASILPLYTYSLGNTSDASVAHSTCSSTFNTAISTDFNPSSTSTKAYVRRLEAQVRLLCRKREAMVESVRGLKKEVALEREARFVVETYLNERLRRMELELDFRDNEILKLRDRQREMDASMGYSDVDDYDANDETDSSFGKINASTALHSTLPSCSTLLSTKSPLKACTIRAPIPICILNNNTPDSPTSNQLSVDDTVLFGESPRSSTTACIAPCSNIFSKSVDMDDSDEDDETYSKNESASDTESIDTSTASIQHDGSSVSTDTHLTPIGRSSNKHDDEDFGYGSEESTSSHILSMALPHSFDEYAPAKIYQELLAEVAPSLLLVDIDDLATTLHATSHQCLVAVIQAALQICERKGHWMCKVKLVEFFQRYHILISRFIDNQSDQLLALAAIEEYCNGSLKRRAYHLKIIMCLYQLDVVDAELLITWFDRGIATNDLNDVRNLCSEFMDWLEEQVSDDDDDDSSSDDSEHDGSHSDGPADPDALWIVPAVTIVSTDTVHNDDSMRAHDHDESSRKPPLLVSTDSSAPAVPSKLIEHSLLLQTHASDSEDDASNSEDLGEDEDDTFDASYAHMDPELCFQSPLMFSAHVLNEVGCERTESFSSSGSRKKVTFST